MFKKIDIIHFLIKKGFYVYKTDSDIESLITFINSLKPLVTGYQLIRIGSKNDGGYLIPDDLEGIDYCYSPGVSDNADFELDLANKGIKCFLADFSVEKSPISHKNINFLKKYISNKIGQKYIDFENWFKVTQKKSIQNNKENFILSMDIEGSELEVLSSMRTETLRKFRIIVLELHDLERIFHQPILTLYQSVINKILENFVVAHIHPNNAFKKVIRNNIDIPPLLEITFLNKSRVKCKETIYANYPHSKDAPNVLGKKDIKLSEHWLS